MTEPIPNPPAGGGESPGAGGAARAPQLRVAASSSGPEPSVIWAWVATAALVLVAGGTLYAARAPVGAALDRWLPALGGAPDESEEAPPEPLPETAPPAEEETGPRWTYVDVEAALAPLPENTLTLIAEGRGELGQFTGLTSKDETRALLIRNRWRLWGRIWHNRVAQIRKALPPLPECLIHAALEPTCRALDDSLTHLDRVPSADSVEAAEAHFAAAFQVVDELLNPPQEELEDGGPTGGGDGPATDGRSP